MFELKKGQKPAKELKKKYQQLIIENLPKINGDFKESFSANRKMLTPQIKLYEYETGPFRKKQQIKEKYIL